MGSGSSKRNFNQTVVVSAALNARENENGNKAEYFEEVRGEKNKENGNQQVYSQENNVKSKDENIPNPCAKGTDDKPKQSTEGTNVAEEPKEETGKLDDLPKEIITLLNSYCEKYPDMTNVLTSTASICHELRESLESGNIITASSMHTNLANKLTSNYFKCKVRLNKTVLTSFTLNFGFPNLVCDIITRLRTQFPELTKWDRAKKNLKQTEEQEPQRSDGESEDKLEDDRAKELRISQDIITALAAAVLNFTDMHDEFCVMCSEAGMVTILTEMVHDLEDAIEHNVKFVNPETQRLSKFTARGKMLSRLLGVLFNLSKRVPVRSKFVSCDAVNVLVPLLKAEVTLLATKALLTLAYLIDEENNHLIMADEGPVKFLVSALNKSLKASNHRYLGFSSTELAEGLTQIAVNDKNKKMIVHCGAIPVLAKMLTAAKENQEKINSCNMLWTLAFDAENRREIKDNKDICAELRNLVSQKNVEVRKAAAGTLWEVELKEKHSEETQPLAKREDSKHIMISYQWDVQSSMIQLKNRLQADGYKVWMDVDQMGGSTLESMAKAVEDACVVLIGVSQKYKESPNCRSEAEYTFQLHRDIIPLMMEKRYKPDGWLGMVVGAKFWIDFTDRYKLDSSIDMLKRELSNRGNIKGEDTIADTTADTLDAVPVPSIQTWTKDDVKQWLVDLKLYSQMNPAAVKQMDGAMLVRLQDLRQESPEFFFSSVAKELQLPSLFDVLRFTDALKKLLG